MFTFCHSELPFSSPPLPEKNVFTYKAKNNNTGNGHKNVKPTRFHLTIVAVEIKKYYILYVSVALFTQHAMRMRRIISSTAVSPAPQYFSTLSHKRYEFRKKKLLNTKCVF